MTWTHFHDMHSGGGAKEPYGHLYIEAPEDEAARIFYAEFGHNPHRISCTCCGPDYSLTEAEDLHQASGYERNCHFNQETGLYEERQSQEAYSKYVPLEVYLQGNVKVIPKSEIPDTLPELPQQGYVWID